MLTRSVLTTEYIEVSVASTVNGHPHDPTGDAVAFAFLAPGVTPGSGDWHAGSWNTVAPGQYVAQCLVGPGVGGVPLAVGLWDLWLRITDNPEIPVQEIGLLTIS